MPRRKPTPPPPDQADPEPIRRLETENRVLTERLTAAGAAGKELQRDLTAARKEADKARAELQAATKRSQSDQVKALAERETLDAELRSARESVAALEANLAEERTSREQEVAALRAAKEALKAEKTESKRLREEDRERVATLEAAEKALADERSRTADAEDLERKLAGLIELNRGLQEQLEGAQADLQTVRRLADEVEARIARAVGEAETLAAKERSRIQKELTTLTAQTKSLTEQLRAQGKTPYLAPEQVSSILDRFYTEVSSGLTGLDVRDSEVRLKVGFAGVSPEKGGLVVPTTENLGELKEGLSEVVLRLGRKEI